MDHSTEAVVTSRLQELNKQGVTLIIATHRHSLTVILDKLLVMDKGKMMMGGPRAEVLKELSKPSKKQ